MTEAQLRNRIGIGLIVAHVVIILLIVMARILDGFDFEEMTTALALIAPMFASYITIIVKHILTNKHRTLPQTEPVSGMFIFISLFFPSLFVVFVMSIVSLKAFTSVLDSFEQFKNMLAVSETLFGVYTGQVVHALFENQPEKKSNRRSESDDRASS